MKTPKPRISNLDEYIAFYTRLLPKPEVPPSADDIRQWLYSYKVLNAFWFEGEIPMDPKQEFSYFLNRDWPNVFLPDTYAGITSLSQPELQFICRKLRKPLWVDSQNVLRGSINLMDIPEIWADL